MSQGVGTDFGGGHLRRFVRSGPVNYEDPICSLVL